MVALVGAALLAGCGGDDDSGTASQPLPTTTVETSPPSAAPSTMESADPAQVMVDCLEEVGYAVETQDPGEYQVTRGEGGSIVANIDVLPTPAQARKFEAELTVDHVSGDTGVAVLLAEADDSDARVIQNCLP
jgi:hypothetical protein